MRQGFLKAVDLTLFIIPPEQTPVALNSENPPFIGTARLPTKSPAREHSQAKRDDNSHSFELKDKLYGDLYGAKLQVFRDAELRASDTEVSARVYLRTRDIYIYIHVYMRIYTHMYMCNIYTRACVCTHTHTHID